MYNSATLCVIELRRWSEFFRVTRTNFLCSSGWRNRKNVQFFCFTKATCKVEYNFVNSYYEKKILSILSMSKHWWQLDVWEKFTHNVFKYAHLWITKTTRMEVAVRQYRMNTCGKIKCLNLLMPDCFLHIHIYVRLNEHILSFHTFFPIDYKSSTAVARVKIRDERKVFHTVSELSSSA